MDAKIYIPDGCEECGFKTEGAVGFDMCSCEDVTIEPKKSRIVDTGIRVKLTRKDIFPALFVRSSLPVKKNLIMLNSVGVTDLDYCGQDDSLKLNLYNFGETSITIQKGERIGQIVFLKFEKPTIEKVRKIEDFTENSRGGFGSTDL